jgi:chitinase
MKNLFLTSCQDIDWEYPGGNGADYKATPDSEKANQIQEFPDFLGTIKAAISPKSLSIAVPGLKRDMIAYTTDEGPQIWDQVDFVNVMAYDLMNRRDNATKHHTDVAGSLASIEAYASRGLATAKMNLGFAFYAKHFATASGTDCSAMPVGCAIALAELADGTDAGTSGAVTFESSPADVADATLSSYRSAMAAGGQTDEENGGQWLWDDKAHIFWTWETTALMDHKFNEIVKAKGLGGVMAWSLGEDSEDWSHLAKLTEASRSAGMNNNSYERVRRIRGQTRPWL